MHCTKLSSVTAIVPHTAWISSSLVTSTPACADSTFKTSADCGRNVTEHPAASNTTPRCKSTIRPFRQSGVSAGLSIEMLPLVAILRRVEPG